MMEQFIQSLESAEPRGCSDEAERTRVTDALIAAMRRFQQPCDILLDHILGNNLALAATKAMIDAGVFQKWAESGGGTKSSEELAHLTGTDPDLIKRLVRHLAALHLLAEVGSDVYQPTPWSTALATDPLCRAWYGSGFYFDAVAPTLQHLPAFLAETGYRNPVDGPAGNHQHLRGTGFFDYLNTRPHASKEFDDAMEYQSTHFLHPWVDIYPTETVFASARAGRALVVDIGGSKGHDLEKFRLRHHHHHHRDGVDGDGADYALPAGSLVLQERPDVAATLAALNLDPAIAVQPHDFFTPQPVRGARVYTLHCILHDWDDAQAVQILTHTAGAMEKGYSRLLIHGYVVGARRPHRWVTTIDMNMMACLAGKERTEAEYEGLLGRAGLKVRQVWRVLQAADNVIEAELA